MMQPNESGEMNISIEGGDLKPGEGIQVDDKTSYEYGANLETPTTPLIDEGRGKTISIRLFEYTMNPELKHFPTDKQLVFNAHAKQIATILWTDGFRPLDEVPPQVIIDRKKRIYRIFVPCEARLNQVVIEKPKNLSQELAKGASR